MLNILAFLELNLHQITCAFHRTLNLLNESSKCRHHLLTCSLEFSITARDANDIIPFRMFLKAAPKQ